MNYSDVGFDDNLNKPFRRPEKEVLTEQQTEEKIEGIPGDKVLPEGIIGVEDGKTKFDLTGGFVEVIDGAVTRFRFGRMEDSTYGVRAWDKNGNIIIDISGDNNIINT